MATIKLNNKEDATDLLCLSNCPTVITVQQTSNSTTEAVRINVNNLAPNDATQPTSITVNGYSINGTDDISKVKSRMFYHYGNGNGGTDKSFCAISIVNALKSIPQLSMDYNIVFVSDCIFYITAKNSGNKYPLNISSENLNNFNITERNVGGTDDVMSGRYFSKIYLDLYYNSNNNRIFNSTTTEPSYNYLTTLQKEYYKDIVSFNISPVLQSVSNNDSTIIWKAKLYNIVDGKYNDLGTISDNYVINGYLVNQGGTYIDMNGISNMTMPAMNVSRGTERTQYNNSIMYLYEPIVDFSLYKTDGVTTENFKIEYLESDETVIESKESQLRLQNGNIGKYYISLDEDLMRDSYYVDITFSFGTLRYNVINPPYSNVECNRVFWYNSYGGISFFDFVGGKEESRSTEVQTYNTSTLDYYYSDNMREQSVVYHKENKIEVTLTSHIIDKDGLYQLYDLQNAYKSWVIIDDVEYYIIVNSLKIDEPSDNVYTATITYTYSLLDSFA